MQGVCVDSPNSWVLIATKMLLLDVWFTRPLILKCRDTIPNLIADKTGETLLPKSESVGRVHKDGGKSGEGKQKLPVEVQQRIAQMWQEIVTAQLGFQNLQEMHVAWKTEEQ